MTILVALVMLLSLTLAACSGGGNNGSGGSNTPASTPQNSTNNTNTPEEEPEAQTNDQPAEITLRVFSTFGGTDAAREAFQAVIDGFVANHPHVTVENDTMSANDDGFRTKVNTDMSSGNEPDLLFYFIGKDAEGFVNAGKVVPMNEILEANTEWARGLSTAPLEQARQADGNIYAIPLTGFYEGLFVNEAIFAEHGLELPTDWEKFTTALSTLSDAGVIPLSAPFDQSHYVIEHFILAAAGAAGQHAGLLDGISPDWELGLSKIQEVYELGGFPQDAATIDLTMAANYYNTGLAGMLIEGSWAIGAMEPDVMENSTVLPFPAIPGGSGTGSDVVAGFGSGFYLSQKTYDDADKQEMAIELLKHLTSPESIQSIAEANGGTPAANVQPGGLNSLQLEGIEMVSNAASASNPVDSKVSPETFTTLRSYIQKIATGEATAAQALEEARKIEQANQ